MKLEKCSAPNLSLNDEAEHRLAKKGHTVGKSTKNDMNQDQMHDLAPSLYVAQLRHATLVSATKNGGRSKSHTHLSD